MPPRSAPARTPDQLEAVPLGLAKAVAILASGRLTSATPD